MFGRGLWLVIALPLVASVVHAAVPELLGYDRIEIADGGAWRLLTAHYVHLNAAHAAMNLVALALTLALLGDAARAGVWLGVYALLSLAISAALWRADPGVVRYVGASGVVHGLIAFGALLRWRRARLESVLLLAGLAIKLVVEARSGASPASEALIGAPVVTAAHRYGAIAGAAIAAIVLVMRRGRAFSGRRQL